MKETHKVIMKDQQGRLGDKVYALCGMASRAREAYPPDYTKAVRQVYLEAAVSSSITRGFSHFPSST